MTEPTNIAERTQLPAELLTLKPDAYVAAVYQSFGERLEKAKASASATDYDVKTTAGMKVAIDRRATLRAIRVEIEKARKERKAPILEIGKLLDTRAKELTAEIEPLEDAHDDLIKAEELRKEAEKQAKVRAEQERVANIQTRIAADIVGAVAGVAHHSAEAIAYTINDIEAIEVTVEAFDEFCGQAQIAKDETLDKLRGLYAAAAEREQREARERAERDAEAARLKAEREEFERMKAEQAERDRIAAEERARAEAEAKAARDAEEARQRAEREAHEAEMRRLREEQEAQLQAQRAELARQQAEIDQQRRDQEAAALKVRQEAEAKEQAERDRIAAEKAEEDEKAAAKKAAEEEAERQRQTAEARARIWTAYTRVLVEPATNTDLHAVLKKAGIDTSFADPLVLALADANLTIAPRVESMKKVA